MSTAPPNFLVCPDEPRVLVQRKVQLAGESLTLICGYLSLTAVICAAAHRGAAQLKVSSHG